MKEQVMITLTKGELDSIIIDCVNACLKHDSRLSEIPVLSRQIYRLHHLLDESGIIKEAAKNNIRKQIESKQELSPDTLISNVEEISVKAYNSTVVALNRKPAATLLDISEAGKSVFLKVRGCGPATIRELEKILTKAGLPF